ncbi:MAG: Protein GrpE [Candidatus Uhrbacteria bacterium GW2011_GWF2_41_16]|jgi:molecular chaperone GrpE|uniref:Protein GrpE n=2 Tax=Candidatus Uhriibacteriota TaxID=1752732 RepID=A0A0G0VBE9_9BACT|nr:MAG: Protein GrpE [Candidatus Uhrbacteria bacterium GW2011_GWA2_41_10]KKR86642.1 MAG: Protein GrpE [Candidatus Uhrbacteria bacterium GW2011_GWC2_41_11]KKR98214.1 MAG: Protein GrpE [Candidatus Uhrbacteria bacterium GW2011_GWF2_41_16]HBP00541.1 nucleotide exchange factor GrpE [Candidatus Uhrbacteria bacterium]
MSQNDQPLSEPIQEKGEESTIEHQCEEYLTGWKRALADYDNLKKTLGEEKESLRNILHEGVLLRLFPLVDHFDQALRYQPKNEDPALQNWIKGVLLVRTQLEDVLRSLGAEPFGQSGEIFDPSMHESAGSRSDAVYPDQSILEVLQRGWKIKERIVRPANVIINIHVETTNA